MQQLQQWGERFDAMSVRERALILATVLVALALPCFSYVIEPAQKEQVKLTAQLQKLKAEGAEAQVNYQLAKAAKVEDPNVALQQQVDQLEQQLEQQVAELKIQSAVLISPDEMIKMLEQILKGHEGVKFLGARKVAPVRISATAGQEAVTEPKSAAEATATGLFRHDLELQLEGRFFQIQGF